MYTTVSHNNIDMCICFPGRKKNRASPNITSPPDPPFHPSYAPSSIYIPPPSTAALPTTVTTTTTRRTSQPTFPLDPKPSCRHCHYTPQKRSTVDFTNQNGNGGRPYYVCVPCKTNASIPPGPNGKGWITWDDNRGMDPGNPECWCGLIARQDRTGVNSQAPGRGFWTCCTGACGYLSWRTDGRTDAEAGAWGDRFVPWLI